MIVTTIGRPGTAGTGWTSGPAAGTGRTGPARCAWTGSSSWTRPRSGAKAPSCPGPSTTGSRSASGEPSAGDSQAGAWAGRRCPVGGRVALAQVLLEGRSPVARAGHHAVTGAQRGEDLAGQPQRHDRTARADRRPPGLSQVAQRALLRAADVGNAPGRPAAGQ